MNNKKTHIYFVPGLAADKEIFENISLPENLYTLHIISWLIPSKKETMAQYAKRMAAFVTEKNAVLVGVSFGGVVAQEMNSFLKLKKLIIISSIKTKFELPTKFKIAKKIKLYKLIPTRLFLTSKNYSRFVLGPISRKRLKLYQDYLHIRDKRYLDWAIKNMLCWKQDIPLPGVYHIHGDNDLVFPIKNINNVITVQGGSHIMLLTKGPQVSRKIVDIISYN
ncbi:alpha/beta hydrolase [Flavobacteriaceae bacterium]|nr:alpha/beta hydrolase [Flavobacteriaceae bacterium]